MDYCLLCLERNKDIFDYIEFNSPQWQSLDITNIIEKHFWPLNAIESDSWICLGCWQKLEDFHNFYVSVDEAHTTFGEIKIEEETDLTAETSTKNETYEDDIMAPELLLIENVEDGKEQLLSVEELKTEEMEQNDNTMEELENIRSDTFENENLQDEINVKITSSDNDDSTTDCNYKIVKSNRRRRPKRTKCKNGMEYKTVEEKDEFIAKEYGQLSCDLCNVSLGNFNDVTTHFQEVHQKKPYVICCGKRFQNRCVLFDHMNVHVNPEYFKCKECDRVLGSRNNLKLHMQQVHPPKDADYKYKCEDCGKSFPMVFMLRKHSLKHVGTEGEFPCNDCGKIYRAEHLLKRHVDVTHLKKCAKVCAICGKTVDTSNDFKVHMMTHETRIPVNCDVCGLLLSSERNYLIHKKQQHPMGGQLEYSCKVCNKMYPSRRSLTRHVTMSHKKVNDKKCEICGRCFKLTLRLKEHMTIHTGDVLYTCEFCPKPFNSKANLMKHRRSVHPKEYKEYKLKKFYGIDKSKANEDS